MLSTAVALVAGFAASLAIGQGAPPQTRPAAHEGHSGATRPSDAPATTQQGRNSGGPDAGSQPSGRHLLDPVLPEGFTLDQMLDYAAKPPPASFGEPIDDDAVFNFTQFELLEYRLSDTGRDELGWDAQGWIGTDDHKFWWKSEGDLTLDGADEGAGNIQALYATPISAFWYLQVGGEFELAWDSGDAHERGAAVVGLQGVAPYQFDVEPALFITDDGDVLGQLTASYDFYLTQRMVLQPRVEIAAAAQDVPELGLGAGLTSGQFDLRLQYQVRREVAPYLGVRYDVLLGETAEFAEEGGGQDHDMSLVFGVRVTF